MRGRHPAPQIYVPLIKVEGEQAPVATESGRKYKSCYSAGCGSLTTSTVMRRDNPTTDYFDSLISSDVRAAEQLMCTFTPPETRRE